MSDHRKVGGYAGGGHGTKGINKVGSGVLAQNLDRQENPDQSRQPNWQTVKRTFRRGV